MRERLIMEKGQWDGDGGACSVEGFAIDHLFKI